MIAAKNWRKALGGGETRPQVFECDDEQEWVLKFPGNPHGAEAGLCADWIGTALASSTNVPVIECALVTVDEAALSTLPTDNEIRRWALPGVAFGSLYLVESEDVLGLTQIEACATPMDLARIVATDTWLDVLDRKKQGSGEWNLLIDKRTAQPSLRVIDFGMAIGEVLGPPIVGVETSHVRCPSEWRASLNRAAINGAIAEVRAIPAAEIYDAVRSIPPTWQVALPRLPDVPAYLLKRQVSLDSLLRGFP